MSSAIEKRFERARSQIWSTTHAEVDHQHPIFCQLSLPNERISERSWVRVCGPLHLKIEAGHIRTQDDYIPLPLPSGKNLRLILLHINNSIIHGTSSSVSLGNNLTQFAEMLNISNGGDHLKELKEQLRNLLCATVEMWNGKTRILSGVFGGVDFWPSSDRLNVWPSRIKLQDSYCHSLRKHPVSLDHRAVSAIMHSATALDTYFWLAYVASKLSPGEVITVDWDVLTVQFGQSMKLPRRFRFRFKKDVERIAPLCPSVSIAVNERGVTFTRNAIL